MKQIILFILVLLPVCAFAQFVETFDGPEIDSANPWKGDLGKFVINDGWLQLNAPVDQKKAELSVPVTYSDNMEWVFDIRLLFEPTNVNCVKIFVYTDKQTIQNIKDEYYIQIGSNDRDVTLRRLRETEKNAKKLITGKANLLKKSTNLLSIKLTLEDRKDWKLYTKTEDQTNYTFQGKYSATVSSFNKGGFFKIQCIYSKTRANLFYFDNINVSSEITDTPEEPDTPDPLPVELPELKGIEILTTSSLQFIFTKPVSIEEAVFSISGIGDAVRTSFADESGAVVNTTFAESLQTGHSYTVSYLGITDLSGNKLPAFSEEFQLEEENNISPGSILINEVMAQPGDAEGMLEYIELYNTTDEPISLKQWVYKNVTGKKQKVLPDVTLSANSYAVLYDEEDIMTIDPSALFIPINKFPSLNDKGALLQLFDASGNLIDEVNYKKAIPAKSWERSSTGDWHLSSDPRGGTPGFANSSGEEDKPIEPEIPDTPETPDIPETPDVPDEPDTPDNPSIPDITIEPGEFIFNELLPNPFTGGSEYIELYNRSDRALPVSGLSVAVRKNDGTLNTRYPLSSVTATIEPDGYVLLTKDLSGVADFYTILSPSSLFEIPKLPILANTSSTLVLFRTKDGTVIDEVSYSSKWHASSIKNQKGIALERIDPEAETQSAANWTSASATSGYGTPGYCNSQSGPADRDDPDHPTGIEAPQWQYDTNSYTLSYYLDQPGYICRAFVFNTAGQRVAEIANHQLLGLSGQLVWDGSSFGGSRLPTDVYIFYAELYHVGGETKRYKQVFLVH